MPSFAVGWYSLFDNELIIELVEAPDWRKAVVEHTYAREVFTVESDETKRELPQQLKEAKHAAFDLDAGLDVKEIL